MSKTTKSDDVTFTTLSELPPSAKLVIKVLEEQSSLTQQELVRETYLPRRTVRHALRELSQAKFVTQKIHFGDARKKLYSLSNEYVQNILQCEREYDA